DLGDRVALHKIGPLRVNGLRRWRAGGKSQVQRQVGHIKRPPVEAESGTRWEQQPLRYAVFIDAIEVAQLGKNLSGGIDNDDLVLLVGRDPDVILTIDPYTIGAVDAVDQYLGLTGDGIVGLPVGNRDLYDLVIGGVCNQHCRSIDVELDPIRPK